MKIKVFSNRLGRSLLVDVDGLADVTADSQRSAPAAHSWGKAWGKAWGKTWGKRAAGGASADAPPTEPDDEPGAQ